MRALIVVRLSRVTDATTSPERQLQTCRELCAQRGYDVVGIAEDLDVTAATAPFDRPQLGDWLTNRLGQFDVLVFYRMDRIVRRLLDLADLIRWCQEHAVSVVSATEQFLDLTAPFGDIIALLVAKVAEMELSAISERNASAARYNIRAGKYRGGVPPWGYLPQQTEAGWRYVQDPEQVGVIHEVVERVLAGEPLRSVAHDLTSRKILTPRDRFAQSQGRKVKGYEWHSGGLKRALTSQTLLGYAVARQPVLDAQGRVQRDAKGRKVFGPDAVVRNDDGSPVVRSEPILTREVFDRLAVELAERENRKEPTKRSSGLLLQVVYCGVCGKPAYRLKGGPGRKPRYRCASAQHRDPCGNKSIPLEDADEAVEALLLALLGESERLERLWDKGSDHSVELTEIDNILADLTDQLGGGVFTRGTPQRARLDARITALAARQAELAAEAVKPAGWTWQPTGEKFAHWWGRQDVTARNVWLRSMGVTLGFLYSLEGKGPTLNLDIGNLDTMTQQLETSGAAAQWQDTVKAMKENGVAGMEMFRDKVVIHGADGRRHQFDLTPGVPFEEAFNALAE
ncbi:recombinase family protein [Mycolicibacterium peregrinum]|uniref:Recombinase family protein n=1 Tax=Mycolicibacterium peregrinum TaxID=43304 RepID=A0A4Z0HQI6_MYCPR|nr:recombinase family protein [Mycolicibacterium peregrinum]TGB41446.1 recombinase family protein [Mycolicibacterium peregrinum]TGB41830.1 recombinase family protein [Mycolicibacterium peregrinum]